MIQPKIYHTNDSECPEYLWLASGKVCEVGDAFGPSICLQGVNKAGYDTVQGLQRSGLKSRKYCATLLRVKS